MPTIGSNTLFAWMVSLGFALLAAAAARAEQPGATLFRARCAVCHTIGGGRLVGPDLDGVTQRRTQSWLVDFITSPRKMLAANDPDALALFEEFNRMPMPETGLSEADALAVLEYIASQSAVANAATDVPSGSSGSEPAASAGEASQTAAGTAADLLSQGRGLFQGSTRLAARGPACNACHHLAAPGVSGGATLAVDLTGVASRLPPAAIAGILARPPFPVMQAAYANRPLQETEVRALTAFLADASGTSSAPRLDRSGAALGTWGVLGTATVYGLCAVLWRNRKKTSVYQDIFDRQGRSS